MWRVILRIISVISFLAGIVGWITLPDDAPLWPKRVGPLLSSMSKDDLLIALFALSAAGFVATFAGPLIGARLAAIPISREGPSLLGPRCRAGLPRPSP
jgi:predicted MFS family arabinose efflux permease